MRNVEDLHYKTALAIINDSRRLINYLCSLTVLHMQCIRNALGTPDNLRLDNGGANFTSVNLSAFMLIGGIILVTIVVAVMVTAPLAVVLKRMFQQRSRCMDVILLVISHRPSLSSLSPDSLCTVGLHCLYACNVN